MDSPDLHPRPEALLAHAEWVRALARGILKDDALADDVVQETWLALLRHPPRGVRDPAAWLASVVRNLARRVQRTRFRGDARDRQTDPPPPPPTPAEILEQEAAQQQVVEAVLGAHSSLDSRYRAASSRYVGCISPVGG